MKKYIFVHDSEDIAGAIQSYGDCEPGHDTIYDACEEVCTDWFDPGEPFTVQEYRDSKWVIVLSGTFSVAPECAGGEELVFEQFGVNKA